MFSQRKFTETFTGCQCRTVTMHFIAKPWY